MVGITKSLSYALESFGIQAPSLDELAKYIGPPLRDSFRELYDFTEDEIALAVNEYREYFSETGIFENVLYPGIPEMLEELKHNGIVITVATSKATVFAERIVEHFKIGKYFDFVAGSELDGRRSQKSEIIEYAISIVDPRREKSPVMIGDRKYDIVGAKEVGIDSIGVSWGYGSRTELETAGATWIVDSPSEICNIVLR